MDKVFVFNICQSPILQAICSPNSNLEAFARLFSRGETPMKPILVFAFGLLPAVACFAQDEWAYVSANETYLGEESDAIRNVRTQCEQIVNKTARRTHQITRNSEYLLIAPGGTGHVWSSEYFCFTTCNEFIQQTMSTGVANPPKIKCYSRLASRN